MPRCPRPSRTASKASLTTSAAHWETSVDYDRDGLHITVYAYDMGKATIADGIGDPTVQHAFDISENEIRDAVKRGIYSNALPFDDPIENRAAKGDWHLHVLTSTYCLTRNGIEYSSRIVVYGARNHIIKLRISTNKIHGTRQNYRGHRPVRPGIDEGDQRVTEGRRDFNSCGSLA